jgi:hypothetical protein
VDCFFRVVLAFRLVFVCLRLFKSGGDCRLVFAFSWRLAPLSFPPSGQAPADWMENAAFAPLGVQDMAPACGFRPRWRDRATDKTIAILPHFENTP